MPPRILPAERIHSQGHIDLLDRLGDRHHPHGFRGDPFCLGRFATAFPARLAQNFLRCLDRLLGGNPPGHDENRPNSFNSPLPISHQPFPGNSPHRFDRPRNRSPEGLIRPKQGIEGFPGNHRRLVIHHADLFRDHPPLPFNFVPGKNRSQGHLRQKRNEPGTMSRRHASVQTKGFLPRKGIQITASPLHLTADFFAGTFFRSLEKQVFDKMSRPMFRLFFPPGSRRIKKAHRHPRSLFPGAQSDRNPANCFDRGVGHPSTLPSFNGSLSPNFNPSA